MIEKTINLESRIGEKPSFYERAEAGVKNWAIDTSAKVGCYAPLMGAMEAYNGLEGDQILQSRATAALIDIGAARVYTRTADYLEEKTKTLDKPMARNLIRGVNGLRESFGRDKLDYKQKREIYDQVNGVRNYITDTSAMVGTYTPIYAVILASAGADSEQIGRSLLMGAGIAAITSRPFRKYILKPYRQIMGFKK